MGWGRGQWYTARWVDRLLFPDNGPSADRLHEEWQHLKVGDRVLDGAPTSAPRSSWRTWSRTATSYCTRVSTCHSTGQSGTAHRSTGAGSSVPTRCRRTEFNGELSMAIFGTVLIYWLTCMRALSVPPSPTVTIRSLLCV